jgi:hypothetical protein
MTSMCEQRFAYGHPHASRGRKVALVGEPIRLLSKAALPFALAACGSFPCGWDTTTSDRSATAGLSLRCEAQVYPVGAHYRNAVSATDPQAALLSIAFVPIGHPDNPSVHFPATLADGTYQLGDSPIWIDPGGTGSLSFMRSRDVPLEDIADPVEGNYASTIDFELHAVLMSSGCQLDTSERIHLTQAGPLLMCERGKLGGSH